MKINKQNSESVAFIPSSSPLVVLDNSDGFSFQCWINSLLDLAVEAVHVNENDDSVTHFRKQ